MYVVMKCGSYDCVVAENPVVTKLYISVKRSAQRPMISIYLVIAQAFFSHSGICT